MLLLVHLMADKRMIDDVKLSTGCHFLITIVKIIITLSRWNGSYGYIHCQCVLRMHCIIRWQTTRFSSFVLGDDGRRQAQSCL